MAGLDLTPIIQLLPVKVQDKAKSIAAAIVSVTTVIGGGLIFVPNIPLWVPAVVVFVGATASTVAAYSTPAPLYQAPGRHAAVED